MVETLSLTILALVGLAVLRGAHAPDAPAAGKKGIARAEIAVRTGAIDLGLAAAPGLGAWPAA